MGPPIKTVAGLTLPKIINLPYKYDLEKHKIEVFIPGFSYSNFNRVGIINLWSFMSSVETCHRTLLKANTNVYPLGSSITGVVASQTFDINLQFYEDAAIVLPCLYTARVAHVDDRSHSFYFDVSNKKTGVQYARCQRKIALVDTQLNKMIPIPKSIREHLDRVKDPSAEPVVITHQKAPDSSLKFYLRVFHSDSDDQYHTNHSSYVRFCMDAAATACNEDKLSNFQGDFFRYKVSRAEIVYRRESHPGDNLEVTLWEDQRSKDILHFIISANDREITIVNLTFFPEKPITSRL